MMVSKQVWHLESLHICNLDLSLPWYDLALEKTHALEKKKHGPGEKARDGN